MTTIQPQPGGYPSPHVIPNVGSLDLEHHYHNTVNTLAYIRIKEPSVGSQPTAGDYEFRITDVGIGSNPST